MANTMIITSSNEKFTFDAVLSVEHKSSVTMTQHPVQYGASITDHAINDPDEVMLSIGMTDVANNVGSDHSMNAFTQLKAIKEARQPVTLVTRLYRYENMLITSLSAPDDYTTMNALKANIILTHLEVVKVATVTVQQTVSASKTTSSSSSKKGSSKKSSSKKKTTKKTTKTTKKADSTLLTKVTKAISSVASSIKNAFTKKK